jgi:hypothetical protein
VNVKNGLQVLALIGVILLALIISMTALTVAGCDVPSSFTGAIDTLIGALVGGTAVHLSVQANADKPPAG